jgi:non-specific serine/threonine protein kinase
MIGESISHYIILEKIGEGGMGVVYKAEDTKLKRTVALKFLPRELTKDAQARARFIQEAQAAAALDHPNICAVFEIGEAEGATYIAMPFVRGQSLKERIAAGPFSVEEALAIAGQVAEGLKEAHEKGIIHRDVKPANIMLTEKGQAKIMDFGLAKLEAGVDLTRTMAVMGTAAYMSPEQARGEEVDYRTDIWSFGATFFEMLTGQKPFGQKHDQALIYSILIDTTATVSRIRPEIPKHLDRVIQKALEKDRARRYQNMAEMLKDLKASGVSELSVSKAEKSIIVLPFEDISPGKDNEYFSDGLTEEIITDLSHVRDLLVISRSSAMTFKGTKKTIPEIAEAVNVRYVLEGSVRKAGNNIRIAAQLIDSLTDTHLWADKFTGTLDDVFDIQEKVSRAIVDNLKLQLTPAEAQKMTERPIKDLRAYECYLRATSAIDRVTESGIHEALRNLELALQIVGENAALYYGMGYAHWWLANLGVAIEKNLCKCKEFAKKALAIDPKSTKARALLWFAEISYQNKNWQREAKSHLKEVLEQDPNESLALLGLCIIYGYAGRPTEAALMLKRYAEREPLSFWTFALPFYMNWFDAQYERGFEEMDRALKAIPDSPPLQAESTWALAWVGRKKEAIAQADRSAKVAPGQVHTKLALMLKHGLQGDATAARAELTPEFYRWCHTEVTWSYFVAASFALSNAKNDALEWLEHAVDLGLINYPLMAEKDPFLANLRSEPRFQKLMERVKYEWEHFEV